MSLFKRFKVTDWYGKEHLFTPKDLYNRIFAESLSDYNWFTSAAELVRVCKQPDFPIEYKNPIMMLILNCFADIEVSQETGGHKAIDPSDDEAVNYCYNALYNVSYRANNMRSKYLKAVIQSVARWHFDVWEFNHHGQTYSKLREQWEFSKFHEFGSAATLDFNQVRKALEDDYEETMKTAESEGVFEHDDEKRRKEINEAVKKFQEHWTKFK